MEGSSVFGPGVGGVESSTILDGDGDGDGVGSTHKGSIFDTNLASMHTYLGEVDDVGSSRLTAQGGSMVTLPMFYLEGVVLFPEQKLPLRVLQPRFKAAVVRAMQQEDNDAPYTLGVIHVRAKHQDQGIIVASVGTTAEIQQLGYCSDGSVNVVTKGRERFQIWRAWTEPDGAMTTLKQASNNDFLEAAESTEDERIAIQFASKNDELSQALEEDSDSSDKASAWGR
ncbi:unnamed protein product [Sphagnum jensenii]